MARRTLRARSALARLRPRARVARWLRRLGRHRFLLIVGAATGVLVLFTVWRPWRNVRAYIGEELGIQRVEALAPEIAAAANEADVDPHLVAAIVFMESRGRVDAVSDKDALGLMQLVSASASDAATRLSLPAPTREELLSDAALNLRLGANHLAWLLENRGDWTDEQVLVAYNAGRGKLLRWLEATGGWSAWRARERDRIRSGDVHTGSLLYAERALDMREVFANRGRIVGGPESR